MVDSTEPIFSTAEACRIIGIEPPRILEVVVREFLPCIPTGRSGVARRLGRHDLLTLMIYRREFFEDGSTRQRAGELACAVSTAAREHPGAQEIAFLDFEAGSGIAVPADDVPDRSQWDKPFPNADIRKVTTFRVGKMRCLIDQYLAVDGYTPS